MAGTRQQPPADGAVARVARVLWPSADSPGHLLRPGGPGLPEGTEWYAAVPHLSRARYLLPLDASPRARARLLLHYNHLRTDRRRAQRLLLAGLAGMGLPGAGRGAVVAVPGPRPGLRQVVAEALGLPPGGLALSVGVRPGTGPVVPTVTVVDHAGTPRAFVKVAATCRTRAELDAEHDVLADMGPATSDGVLVPRPLFRLEWEGALVVGIEPLPLDVRRVGPEELDAVQPFHDGLVASRPTSTTDLGASPWFARLRGHAGDLPPATSQPLLAALDATLARHGARSFRHGLRHGDWSSWNMAWSAAAGGLAVWDWEFSEPMAPVGLDRCNWHFAYDTSVRGLSMTDAAARLRSHPATVADPDLAELFLLDMAVRRARQAAGGDRTSQAYVTELLALLR